MIVKIKKYVAKVTKFKEHEDDTITKEIREIVLEGKQFSPATARKLIPRDAKLLESSCQEVAYEIDVAVLEKFLSENGKPVATENAE